MLSLDLHVIRLYTLPQTSRVENEFNPINVAEVVNPPVPQTRTFSLLFARI